MKPLRVPVALLREGDHALDRDAANYVLRVHRMRPGQPLVLFDPMRGIEAAATLLHSTAKAATCRIEAIRSSEAVPTLSITLLQALAKGDKVDRVVRDATALGVGKIVVVTSSRCAVRREVDASRLRLGRWQRIAIEAARQCGRGNIPEIAGPIELHESLALTASCPLRLLLTPGAATRLSTILHSHAVQPIAVFIGPEGGLDPEEAQALSTGGFLEARFGQFTLRTEIAATALLGALIDWGWQAAAT